MPVEIRNWVTIEMYGSHWIVFLTLFLLSFVR